MNKRNKDEESKNDKNEGDRNHYNNTQRYFSVSYSTALIINNEEANEVMSILNEGREVKEGNEEILKGRKSLINEINLNAKIN